MYKGRYRSCAICVKLIMASGDTEGVNVSPITGLFVIRYIETHVFGQAFIKEATLWAHLSHSNILPFYGVFLVNKTLKTGLVSPWMEKGNLCDYSKNLSQERRLPLVSVIR